MKRPPNIDIALNAVRAVYKELDGRPINRDCIGRTECCHFKLTGLTPHLTKGEAMLAAKALRATGRTKIPERPDGACPLLHPHTSKCLIYNDRPFGCRTHFCEAAGGPYSRREVIDLIHKLEQIDDDLFGSGSQNLPSALATAMRETA